MAQIRIDKNILTVAVIIIVLVIAAVFAYKAIHKPAAKPDLVYNNFEFYNKSDGMWHTAWQRDGQVFDVSLRYSPLEVENVPTNGGLNETFLRAPYYITFDPDSNSSNSANNTDFKYLALAFSELGLSWSRGMGNEVITACTKNLSEPCAGHPIVTCDDDDKAVFYVRIAEKPRVTLDGNCLTMEGSGIELIKAVDRVLYHFYRIMP